MSMYFFGQSPGPLDAAAASGPAAATAPALATLSTSEDPLALRQELDSLRLEHTALRQAIYEAAQVQRRLCSPRELVWGEFEVAGEIFPVRHLSGDFFQVFDLGSSLALAVGDIAGKGFTAGLWHAHLIGLIQRAALRHSDPAAVAAEVNAELCGNPGEPPLTALFFARLDLQSEELVFCNAGLPSPLLFRRDAAPDVLDAGGPMLGALSTAQFSSASVTLHPGDMFLAYSDGVTECRNPGDEEFQSHRLSSAASALRGSTARQALFSTLGAVLDFAGSASPSDDLTLLVVRRSHHPAQRVPHEFPVFSLPLPPAPSSSEALKPPRRGRSSGQSG